MIVYIRSEFISIFLCVFILHCSVLDKRKMSMSQLSLLNVERWSTKCQMCLEYFFLGALKLSLPEVQTYGNFVLGNIHLNFIIKTWHIHNMMDEILIHYFH